MTDEHDDTTEETEGLENVFHLGEPAPIQGIPGVIAFPEPEGDLNREQQARVTALYHARQVLESKKTERPLQGPSTVAPPPAALIQVAQWIVEGR